MSKETGEKIENKLWIKPFESRVSRVKYFIGYLAYLIIGALVFTIFEAPHEVLFIFQTQVLRIQVAKMRRKKDPVGEGARAIWWCCLLRFRIEQKILRGSRKIQKSRIWFQLIRENSNFRWARVVSIGRSRTCSSSGVLMIAIATATSSFRLIKSIWTRINFKSSTSTTNCRAHSRKNTRISSFMRKICLIKKTISTRRRSYSRESLLGISWRDRQKWSSSRQHIYLI